MAHLVAETGAAAKVSGPALFGMGAHQAEFRSFLNAHFQPQHVPAANGGSVYSDGRHSSTGSGVPALSPAANGALVYPSSNSEPGSPACALPVAGKALSADVIGGRSTLGQNVDCPSPGRLALQQQPDDHDDTFQNPGGQQQRQHDSASSADYSPAGPEDHEGGPVALQGELLPPPIAKDRFGAFAKRLQVQFDLPGRSDSVCLLLPC